MVNTMKFINTFITYSLIFLGLLLTSLGHSETAVIVHPSNNNDFSSKDIQRIFLGKLNTFRDGGPAIPLDQKLGNTTRKFFIKTILKKTDKQMTAYWSRQVFTGRGLPPKEVDDPAALKKLVAENPNTIGYIDASIVDKSIKVVHRF